MGLPIKDGKITTPYNKKGKMWKSGFHTGVDFAVPTGTDIIAACDGTVVANNWGAAYGKQVIVKANINGKDVWMIYAHCSQTMVKAGAKVKTGQHIAESGNTGNSSGPHLHFEVRDNARWSAGKPVDPKDILAI
jgi:murein DD-endopeptidase MepM/ murein hydrolase activator NlpD